MGKSHLQTISESLVDLRNTGAESEPIVPPAYKHRLKPGTRPKPVTGLIGSDSDSDFAESQPQPKKSRLGVSASKGGPNNQSRKVSQHSKNVSPAPSSSGLQSKARESSEEFWDPVKSKLVKYKYRESQKHLE